MILIWLVIIFVLPFFGMKPAFKEPDEDYMSVERTTSVKGFFALIIFLSHVRGYLIPDSGNAWEIFSSVLSHIGQLMVTMFFFYSGYGVFESFKRKPDYRKGFFRKRILKTLVNFDLAVVLYLILDIALQKEYPVKNYFLCWTGWEGIGNSNWFIFIMLVLYVISFLSFCVTAGAREPEKGQKAVLASVIAMTAVLFVLLRFSDRKDYWYNTVFCYSFGMLFSYFKDSIDRILSGKTAFPVILVAVIILFLLFYFIENAAAYNVCACCFCLIVSMITMKVRISNPVLIWLGRHAFSIYILQRIPMIALQEAGVSHNMLFILCSLVLTICISAAFERLLHSIDKRLFK